MLFTPKLISSSFKGIEAFSEKQDIAASVIEELIRNTINNCHYHNRWFFNVPNATVSSLCPAYRI
jgi:hypothetical protein